MLQFMVSLFRTVVTGPAKATQWYGCKKIFTESLEKKGMDSFSYSFYVDLAGYEYKFGSVQRTVSN